MTSRTRGIGVLIAGAAALIVELSVVATVQARGGVDAYWLTANDSGQRYYRLDKWYKAVSPETLGWSSARLSIAERFSKSLDTAAVVIVDKGVIVYEWGSTDERYKVHSMRKSLLNAPIRYPCGTRDNHAGQDIKGAGD